jgi:hypothetical protein
MFMGEVIERVPSHRLNINDGRVNYVSHTGVYHPRKPDQILLVFDCSVKFDGISLQTQAVIVSLQAQRFHYELEVLRKFATKGSDRSTGDERKKQVHSVAQLNVPLRPLSRRPWSSSSWRKNQASQCTDRVEAPVDGSS